jgi:hypothetical protein
MKHLAVSVVTMTAAFAAQSASTSQGRGAAGQPVRPAPLAMADHAGFESIFDGSSMKNRDGGISQHLAQAFVRL